MGITIRFLVCAFAVFGSGVQTQAQFTNVINVPPAFIGHSQSIGSETQLNVFDGGTVGVDFSAGAANGSSMNVEVNVIGGTVGSGLNAYGGSTVNVSGGTIGGLFRAHSGSEINISGGDNAGITANRGSVLYISNGSIDRVDIALGSTAHISGGFIEDFISGRQDVLNAEVATVNITGGTIGPRWYAYEGRVTISGGVVGESFYAWNDTVVNISGGEIGKQFRAMPASEVNISGGSIGAQFVINSVVNISGGTFGNLLVDRFGKVHLLGRQFVLDGVDITSSLVAGDLLTITQRGVTLSGLLADGSPFSFDLNTTADNTQDVFTSGSLLTVTLVPEPCTIGWLVVSVLVFLRRSPPPTIALDS